MSRAYRFALLFLTLMLAQAPFCFGIAEDPIPDFAKLERGMTPEQVRLLVGAPKQIARQIFYHRYREQWTYDAAVPVRLTFDCPRGQKPQLLSAPVGPDKAEPRP